MKLLCLSNGHGEDAIAIQVLQQLRSRLSGLELVALPLVGEGYAYAQHEIPTIGPVRSLPSGGFVYMDGRQLWRDVRGGLLGLTLAQLKAIGRWSQTGGKILAVGDIVPLLFAYLSGADYAFIGTAKSEYYLRDENGWYDRTSWLEKRSGSVYWPWERWLMSRQRCRAVFPRDELTAAVLRKLGIAATFLGNPMMDAVGTAQIAALAPEPERPLIILLLPGSRLPEALDNWQLILQAIPEIAAIFRQRPLVFLAAIAPALPLEGFQAGLQGWKTRSLAETWLPVQDSQGLAFQRGQSTLLLTQTTYAACLQVADVGIGMAGTAIEQFVGLGKPIVTLVGRGPQFTPAFAEAQTRLLGPSVTLVQRPAQVAAALNFLLSDPDCLQMILDNGQRRLGPPGAAARIADYLPEKLA